jgi:PQQ-like domain/Divergent InlB B-repeat domain
MKRINAISRVRTGLVLLVLCLLAVQLTVMVSPGKLLLRTSFAQPAPIWPMYQHDAQRTSQSAFAGPSSNSTDWIFQTNSSIVSSPVIGPDGTIYVATADFRLYALHPDGSVEWSRQFGEPVYTPAIGSDGTIYVPTLHHVYALSPSDGLEWSSSTLSQNYGTALAVGANGNIFSVNDGSVYDFNSIGQMLWSAKTDCIHSSPAVDPSGNVYCTGDDGNLYAILPSGSLNWKFNGGGTTNLTPVVTPNDTIFFGTTLGTLYGISPPADEVWNAPLHKLNAPVILSSGGQGYAISNDFYEFNPSISGSFTKEICYSSSCIPFQTAVGMAIDSAGNIFLAQNAVNSSSLLALTSTGGFEWAYNTSIINQQITGGPAIGANGTVYFGTSCTDCNGTSAGQLYAVGMPASNFPVMFNEYSLPNGSTWSITFNGEQYVSSYSSMIFSAPGGNYSYIANPSYRSPGMRYISSSNGSVNVDTNIIIPIPYQEQYGVTVNSYPSQGGGVTVAGLQWYFPNSSVNLSASPSTGYAFGAWGSSSASLQLTNSSGDSIELFVNGSGVVTANFYPGITVTSGTGGSISYSYDSHSGTIESNDSSTLYLPVGSGLLLTVHPSTDYAFGSWQGVPSAQQNLYAISYTVGSPTSIAANFVSQGTSVTTTSSTSSSQSAHGTSASTTSTTSTTGIHETSSTSTTSKQSPRGVEELGSAVIVAVVVICVLALFLLRKRSS